MFAASVTPAYSGFDQDEALDFTSASRLEVSADFDSASCAG
jgi:hypothetical protein